MPRDGIGARVVRPEWSERNRVPSTSMMTATVRIERPDRFTPGVFNDTTGGQDAPAAHVVATALPARVSVARQVSDLNLREAGEELVGIRRYLVQIPWNWTDITVKDVITVVDAEDPTLVGRAFQVRDIQAESFQWSRVLRCEVYQR